MSRDRDNRRISTIIDRLERLTIEAQDLTQELRQLQSPPAIPQQLPTTNYDHPYKIGDRVVITNSYLGKRGVSGTVTNTTEKRVTLTDDTGRSHTRKPSNIKYE